ncbi:DUF6804 family protein [Chitinophaga sp.]|uniref:DUF6804 family protein n=1 Tax=Chitinophaga sp. TaxID=1869181 RepID=UPI0031D0C012
MRRVFALTPAYLLWACIFTTDEEHFRIMHFLVPFCAALLVYDTYHKMQDLFFVLFLLTIVLYNPLIPVDYYMRPGWICFDMAFGTTFLVKVFLWGKVAQDKIGDKEIRRSARRAMALRNAENFGFKYYEEEDD